MQWEKLAYWIPVIYIVYKHFIVHFFVKVETNSVRDMGQGYLHHPYI